VLVIKRKRPKKEAKPSQQPLSPEKIPSFRFKGKEKSKRNGKEVLTYKELRKEGKSLLYIYIYYCLKIIIIIGGFISLIFFPVFLLTKGISFPKKVAVVTVLGTFLISFNHLQDIPQNFLADGCDGAQFNSTFWYNYFEIHLLLFEHYNPNKN